MLVHDGRVRGGVEGKDFEVHGPNGASWQLRDGGREGEIEEDGVS
jgi:hypothetical protein